MQLFSLGKTISIGIFIKIQWANFDELILFNCWLLNMFFPFSSVSNQTYLLRKNRYQLTVFDRLNSYKESISICQFLHFLCIEDIAKYVERTYYTNKDWHFRYTVSSMIKLFIVQCFRTLSYDKTVSSLTVEEAILLSFFAENDQIKLPSGGTLHHFVKYRLGEEGI